MQKVMGVEAVDSKAMWLKSESGNTEAEHMQMGKTCKAEENKSKMPNILR